MYMYTYNICIMVLCINVSFNLKVKTSSMMRLSFDGIPKRVLTDNISNFM